MYFQQMLNRTVDCLRDFVCVVQRIKKLSKRYINFFWYYRFDKVDPESLSLHVFYGTDLFFVVDFFLKLVFF